MIALLLLALAAWPDPDFERDVAPILEARCLACHDDDNRKGGLSLVTRAQALAGGNSEEPAIVPGDPDRSELIAAVSAMAGEPPAMPRKQAPLLANEIEALRSWIASGAAWPEGRSLRDRGAEYEFAKRADWWSLRPLADPPVPKRLDGSVDPNPIDAFVNAKLREHGIEPSPLADRRTLIRRVTYDLSGLPPSPEEVDAFAADRADDAYERLVDRLLAAPSYGERFARAWLDLVHFGETHGYDKDKPRPNAWPYRDYVIESLNADLPYDRFVLEQLAGDVIAPHDPNAIAATGFLAAGPWDFVGHVELREGTKDKAITRNLDRDDMVTTAISTFTSTTVHCARCHDHKFDAITQADYYSLQAVFAGIERADREYDLDPETTATREGLRTELASFAPSDPARARLGWHGAIEDHADAECWVAIELPESAPIDDVIVVPAHESYGGWPGPGFGFPVRFVVEIASSREFSDARVIFDASDADRDNPGDHALVIDAGGAVARCVRVRATRLWQRTGDFAFALGELAVTSGDRNLARGGRVFRSSSIEAPPRWAAENLIDGIAWSGDLGEGEEGLAAWRARLGRRDEIESHLAALPAPRRVYAGTSRFSAEGAFTPSSSPRTIHLLRRGDVSSPDIAAGEVGPGALSCVPGSAPRFADAIDEGARRLALARWIVSSDNPLTWRSIVNRVWGWHFGVGIVSSANDFGHMGSTPTHPELLDALARWFLKHGASRKALDRLIVTSETYRRSSITTEEQFRSDATNAWLARSSRRRLDAESIHDSLLVLSDRLDPRRGGPSDRHFVFRDDHSPVYDYTGFAPTLDLPRRRAIYRFVVRSVADPFFETLDCPDASLLAPTRSETITALQALALLNDPFVLEAAERFAARVERDAPASTVARIDRAFRLALARGPTPDEVRRFGAHADRYGLASACRALLNLSEFHYLD